MLLLMFYVLLSIYALFPIISFPLLFLYDAPYGKFSDQTTIGPKMNGKVSWFLQELWSAIIFLWVILQSWKTTDPLHLLLAAMWTGHYFNRSIIYTIRAPGMSPSSIGTCIAAIIFNTINGFTNGYWLSHNNSEGFSFRTMVGIILWVVGLVGNIHHDSILFSLREKSASGKKDYKIPFGSLFNYVSCPNYLCEILEWVGFAIAAWPSPAALIFALSTPANLVPRAWRTHQWYISKFGSKYPRERRALIPWLF